jgi:hypothetical protein
MPPAAVWRKASSPEAVVLKPTIVEPSPLTPKA